jgi:hypothetical protein
MTHISKQNEPRNLITLDENDIRLAAHVAFDRGWASFIQGSKNVNGGEKDPFYRHVIGALGEVAFAKWADLYWDGSIGRFRGMGGDVGKFQIRARQGYLPLIIRPTDGDQDVFVLVCKVTPITWDVYGWTRGMIGKQRGKVERMQGGPRYLVDPSLLADMRELMQ